MRALKVLANGISQVCPRRNTRESRWSRSVTLTSGVSSPGFKSWTSSHPFGLPWWLGWWRICLQCRRPWFDPWVGKTPWRREQLPPLVFWPGEFQGLCGPWGRKESDVTFTLIWNSGKEFTELVIGFDFKRWKDFWLVEIENRKAF